MRRSGRPRKRSCNSSFSFVPLDIRLLDVWLRNEAFFSERTHPYQESSHNSSQNNLIILNRNLESYNISNSLSQSLITENSLFTSQFIY